MNRSIKLLALLCLTSLLVACASSGKYTPSVGHYKVGKPYKIKGKTYYPKESYTHTEVGVASWYGPGFHGKLTANGERFDENALTAAHPTLQMPSFVRVTNLDNGNSLILRVNDRGPFSGGRIIDVSKAAAEELGFRNKGLAKVRVQVLEMESRIIGNAAKNKVDTTGSEIALNKSGTLDNRFAAYAPGYQTPAPLTPQNPTAPDSTDVMLAQNEQGQFAAQQTYAPQAYAAEIYPDAQPQSYQQATYQPASYQVETTPYAPAPNAPTNAAPITLQISQPIIEPRQTAAHTARTATQHAPAQHTQTATYTPTSYHSAPTGQTAVKAPIAANQAPVANNGYFVQAGNFLSNASANVLRDQIIKSTGQNARVVPARPGDAKYFRVEMGPLTNHQSAQFLVDTLEKQGRQALVIHR